MATIIQSVEPRYHATRDAAIIRFNSEPCKLWVRKLGASKAIKPYATGDLQESRLDDYSLIGENGYPATIHEGRLYTLRGCDPLPHLCADLPRRGYDGTCWMGTSEPVGKQRKTFYAMFYRLPSGEFELVAKC